MGKKLSKQVKKQLLNVLFLVVLVGVTIVVLVTSNRELNFENIGEFLAKCNPWWIVAAFVATFGFIFFEGLSIHFILRGLGERPKLLSSLVYSTADIYYSAITPSASGGQPASAYYMVKDGVGAGKSSFTLVFNLVAYTASIIIIGIFAFAARPEFYGMIESRFTRILLILGFVVQGLLLLFFIACMFCGRAVLKCGNGIITLLVKLHIVKKPDKWREKLKTEVEKYRDCVHELKKHPALFFSNMGFNLAQRASHVLVSCFVCMAAAPQTNFLDLFVLEAFVLIGYNSIPLPGGVGAFEYLYLNIYCIAFDDAFILVAMMVTRVISYYFRTLVCGIYTLAYHVRLMRRSAKREVHTEEENCGTEEFGTEESGTEEQ